MKSLSILIPIYNNAQTIPDLVKEITSAIIPLEITYEIILINDGSKDNTIEIVNDLSIENNRLRIINLPFNIGQQNAIIKGIDYVDGERIIVMDADLQDSPRIIEKLYIELTDDFDTVFVRRRGNYQSPLRMLTSKMLKSIVQLIIGLNYRAGSYLIFNKRLISRIKAFSLNHRYATVMIMAASKKVGYIDAHRESGRIKSSYTTKKRLISGYTAIMCAFECRFLNK